MKKARVLFNVCGLNNTGSIGRVCRCARARVRRNVGDANDAGVTGGPGAFSVIDPGVLTCVTLANDIFPQVTAFYYVFLCGLVYVTVSTFPAAYERIQRCFPHHFVFHTLFPAPLCVIDFEAASRYFTQ